MFWRVFVEKFFLGWKKETEGAPAHPTASLGHFIRDIKPVGIHPQDFRDPSAERAALADVLRAASADCKPPQELFLRNSDLVLGGNKGFESGGNVL